jgi:transcriptional regulator with PAS, ATPase and Fis domain
MKSITELIDQEDFLKNLFESIPCGVFVIDEDRRVQAVNNVLEQVFRLAKVDAVDHVAGEALKCVHAFKNPKGCGFSEECVTCGIRNTALQALAGNKIHRSKAQVKLLADGKPKDFDLLISAAPFKYEKAKYAIVVLEDMTELNTLRRRLKTEHSFSGIVGNDVKMSELFETIRQVSDVNVPILVQGESGTGKELVASAIHNEGPRANKPFVPVNCGALPEGLLESELFGHVKGAFTGALRDKKGRFELAHGGTLFLDEVADLTKVVQAKLLRVLQEGLFERVGDEKTISVNVRIISAANRDLKQEVKKGNFRDDLYYRLSVVPIFMPPLRERKTDIPLLIDHFMSKIEMNNIRHSVEISDEAMAMMMSYNWPGNVRELQNAIQFAMVKFDGHVIQPKDLPMELQEQYHPQPSRGPARKLNTESVASALRKTGGNKAKAARLLGVGRATLYRFLAEHPDILK